MSLGWHQNWSGCLGENSFAPFQESNHDSLIVEPASQLLIVWFFEYFFTVRLM
jgi:hypothetical protein